MKSIKWWVLVFPFLPHFVSLFSCCFLSRFQSRRFEEVENEVQVQSLNIFQQRQQSLIPWKQLDQMTAQHQMQMHEAANLDQEKLLNFAMQKLDPCPSDKQSLSLPLSSFNATITTVNVVHMSFKTLLDFLCATHVETTDTDGGIATIANRWAF